MFWKTPLFFLLLLPLAGVVFWVYYQSKSKFSQDPFQKLVSARLKNHLIVRSSDKLVWIRFLSAILATIFIILSLCRLILDHQQKPLIQELPSQSITLILDLSNSMLVEDVKPNRLSVAKVAMTDLIDQFPTTKIGLIGFARTPDVLSPPTRDHHQLKISLSQANTQTPFAQGSDINAAISLAIESFSSQGNRKNLFVLISDGEEHTGKFEKTLARARAKHGVFYTLGIGSQSGASIPRLNKNNPILQNHRGKSIISKLEATNLKFISKQTGGNYYELNQLNQLISSLKEHKSARISESSSLKIDREASFWFLQIALFLLCLNYLFKTYLTSRRIKTALSLWLLFIPLQAQQEASLLPTSDAISPINKKIQHASSTNSLPKQTSLYLQRGQLYYQNRNYQKSLVDFSTSLLSQNSKQQFYSHLGLGNSMFQLGWKSLFPQLESFPEAQNITTNKTRLNLLKLLAKNNFNDQATLKKVKQYWNNAISHYQAISQTIHPKSIENNLDLTRKLLRQLNQYQPSNQANSSQQNSSQQPSNQANSSQQNSSQQPSNQANSSQQNSSQQPSNQANSSEKTTEKDQLKSLNAQKSKDLLSQLNSNQLKEVLNSLDQTTLKKVLNQIDTSTLKEIKKVLNAEAQETVAQFLTDQESQQKSVERTWNLLKNHADTKHLSPWQKDRKNPSQRKNPNYYKNW